VVLSLVVVMMSLAFYQLTLYFGGGNEIRHAVDAGALNVGQKALTIKVYPETSDEHQFDDVDDSSNGFGLADINRVWGKALLVAANVEAMKSEGTYAGAAGDHAQQLFEAAQSLSNRLADKLNTPSNHYSAFKEIAAQNSVRMFGSDDKVHDLPGAGWQTSLLDRGAESNLYISDGQLPDGFDDSKIKLTNKDGKRFFNGYQAMKILDRDFFFVPFKLGETTHLVSRSVFDANTKAAKEIPGWEKPVSNAFSVNGQATDQRGYTHTAFACVQTNPQKPTALQIPKAFIRVKLGGNKITWTVNGLGGPSSTSYDYFPPGQTKTSSYWPVPTDGLIQGTVIVGNEFLPPTLEHALFPIASVGSEATIKALLQRVREIKPDATKADLTAALESCPILPGVTEYFICLISGNVVALEKTAATASSINVGADPDGTETTLTEETGPPQFPNFVINPVTIISTTLLGLGSPTPLPSFATLNVKHKWKPGSGYDGCLGELTVEHTTKAYLNGAWAGL